MFTFSGQAILLKVDTIFQGQTSCYIPTYRAVYQDGVATDHPVASELEEDGQSVRLRDDSLADF